MFCYRSHGEIGREFPILHDAVYLAQRRGDRFEKVLVSEHGAGTFVFSGRVSLLNVKLLVAEFMTWVNWAERGLEVVHPRYEYDGEETRIYVNNVAI